MDKIDFLSRIPLFTLLKKEELQELAGLTEEHRVQAGDIIIHEGERDNRLFMIVEGMASVIVGLGTRGERKLGKIGPHSYVGEMALVDDLVRSASVIALEDTLLLTLDGKRFLDSIQSHPPIAMELLQTLSRRVRALEKSLMDSFGGMLPICANCKKIRDEQGEWVPVEIFISGRCEAEFSHSICPECSKILYNR